MCVYTIIYNEMTKKLKMNTFKNINIEIGKSLETCGNIRVVFAWVSRHNLITTDY